MKRVISLVILLLLTSCQIDESVFITRNENDIYVQFEHIFDYNKGYFYFYMDGCVSCDSLKNHIVTYALNNNDFYLVIPSNKFNYGYDRSFNNGVTNYQDIVIIMLELMRFLTCYSIKKVSFKSFYFSFI